VLASRSTFVQRLIFLETGGQVREAHKLAQKLHQLQPIIAVQECIGQLASFGPTSHLSRCQSRPDGARAMGVRGRRGSAIPSGGGSTPCAATALQARRAWTNSFHFISFRFISFHFVSFHFI
jgi:hypothetical protein